MQEWYVLIGPRLSVANANRIRALSRLGIWPTREYLTEPAIFYIKQERLFFNSTFKERSIALALTLQLRCYCFCEQTQRRRPNKECWNSANYCHAHSSILQRLLVDKNFNGNEPHSLLNTFLIDASVEDVGDVVVGGVVVVDVVVAGMTNRTVTQ